MRVLDLFSGIGGFSLGLERAGMRTVAFCEQDGYACRVLRKHWPTVPIFEDIRTLTGRRLAKHGIEAEVLCGGFPCQDISLLGGGAGLDGEQSGLWSEMLRLVREIRPDWVLAENVPALKSRGADQVLTGLEGAGYATRPLVVGAWAVGAQHRRDRVWILANTKKGRQRARQALCPGNGNGSISAASCGGWWDAEPNVGRVANGVPARVDRLRCLGNAVVPQVVEMIGRAIMACHQPLTEAG